MTLVDEDRCGGVREETAVAGVSKARGCENGSKNDELLAAGGTRLCCWLPMRKVRKGSARGEAVVGWWQGSSSSSVRSSGGVLVGGV